MRCVFTPGSFSRLGMTGPMVWPSIGIAVQRLGVEHEPAACRLGRRRDDAHLAAELVEPWLSTCHALDFRRVRRTFGPRWRGPWNPHRQRKQFGVTLPELRAAGDLAADVAPTRPSLVRSAPDPGAIREAQDHP